MRCREFITLLGGAAAAWPLAARAQQQSMPVIGYLSALSESQIPNLLEALRRGLSDGGFVEGMSVIIGLRKENTDAYKPSRPSSSAGRLALSLQLVHASCACAVKGNAAAARYTYMTAGRGDRRSTFWEPPMPTLTDGKASLPVTIAATALLALLIVSSK